MKCLKCGGIGCYECDGTGEYEPFDADIELDKLYPTEQTNEAWFCDLSTEEKAKWIENKLAWAAREQGYLDANYWARWLKEEHKDA